MARRLIWSPRALAELRAILDFIGAESPGNARAVLGRFEARLVSLPDQPAQGRRVPEQEPDGDLREVFVHRWRMIYEFNDSEVEIVAVVHGARLLGNAPPLRGG